MQKRFADKKEVAELVSTWLTRSGLRQVAVANEVGLATSDVFYQGYKDLSRKINTNPDNAIAIVEVFAKLPSGRRCKAAEVIRFFILTQLPLNRYTEVQGWFPPEEWQNALREHAPDLGARTNTERLSKQELEKARNVGLQLSNPTPAPFLAPPRLPYELIGRHVILNELKQKLVAGDSAGLFALYGLPGIGKTALALTLAHDRDIREHFSDGVLWAGLGRWPDVLSLLNSWADALGISNIAEKHSVEEQAKAIHDAIGARHMLLIVDDAWEIEKALAFKLGGPNCTRLITTRLPEVALRFAHEESQIVQELDETDSLTLLNRLAPEAVHTEPEDARTLVQAVGGLPLALVLMGNYLRVQTYDRNSIRLRAALHKLNQAEARLRLAEAQSPVERHPSFLPGTPLSLETVIAISEEALDEDARQAFWSLSVFPPKPNTFSMEAAQAVSNISPEVLSDYGLLESSGSDRYTMHQSLSDYAKLKLADESAYERFVKFFVDYVETHEADFSALNLETNNILSMLQMAFDRNMSVYLARGANSFYPFLESRGLYELAKVHLERALNAARSFDMRGVVISLYNLGRIEERCGRYEAAEAYSAEALILAREIGMQERVSALLRNLGTVSIKRGDYEQAKVYLREGLVLTQSLGQNKEVCDIYKTLGVLEFKMANYSVAEEYFLAGLSIARQFEDSDRVSGLLVNLGTVADELGRRTQATSYFQESLHRARQIGHNERISLLLLNLGVQLFEAGDYQQSEQHFREGLSIARQIGHMERTSNLLSNLGWLYIEYKEYAQAETNLMESLTIARNIGSREKICISLRALGDLALRRNNHAEAEEYLQESLTIAREMKNLYHVGENLNVLGEIYLQTQDLVSALKAFSEVLDMNKEAGSQAQTATALYGMARTRFAQGYPEEARSMGRRSQEIFKAINHNRAFEVEQWINTLPN